MFFNVGWVVGIFHVGLVLFLFYGLFEGEWLVLMVLVGLLEHVAGLFFCFDEFGGVALGQNSEHLVLLEHI